MKTPASSPPLTLSVRRGSKVIPRFPVKLLVPYIQDKKLLPGDEISPDGVRWLRLEKYPLLARYFQGGAQPAVPPGAIPAAKAAPANDSPPPAPPPRDMTQKLENLAHMLKDLNR